MTISSEEIQAAISHSKTIYVIASGLVTLLLGRSRFAPFEDDMQFHLKPILVCIAIAVAFLAGGAGLASSTWMIVLVTALIVLVVVYYGVYYKYGYNKVIMTTSGWWIFKKTKYKQFKVLGGLRLTPEAVTATASGRDVQTFFADCAYVQDDVWPRSSRIPVQITAVGIYFLIVLALLAIPLLAGWA